MASLGVPIIWALIACCGVVLGIIALRVARRPRGGSHPYCRACGYNLTGNVSGMCSECGADLSQAGAVRVGKRSQRVPLALGAACVLVLVFAACMLWKVDWYALSPTSWLIVDLNSPTRIERATSLLSERYESQQMSTSDVEKYGNAQFATVLNVRPVMTAGEWYILRVEADSRLPLISVTSIPTCLPRAAKSVGNSVMPVPICYVPFISLPEARLGGRALPRDWHRKALEAFSAEKTLQPDQPGPQELSVDVEVHWGRGEVTRKTLTTMVDVRPRGGDEDVALVRDPAIDEQVRSAVHVEHVVAMDWSDPPIRLHADRLPIDLAFDVTLLLNAGGGVSDHGTGMLRVSKDGYIKWLQWTGLRRFDAEIWNGTRPIHATVVLRASRAAARETFDLTRIWGGELVFRDVPVKYVPSSDATTTAPSVRSK